MSSSRFRARAASSASKFFLRFFICIYIIMRARDVELSTVYTSNYDDRLCTRGDCHLINHRARLAIRLMTLMLALFGVVVWIPRLIAHPGAHLNWSEFALTFLIT